jgi:hypothetical protein
MHRVAARSHENDNAFGIGGADIFIELILASGQFGEFVHVFLDDGRTCGIVFVNGFTALEEHIGVLRSPLDGRMVGGQSARAHRSHEIIVDHGAHVVEGQFFNFLDFMRSPKPVIEMDEGHAGFKRCGLCNQRKVHGFLHGA